MQLQSVTRRYEHANWELLVPSGMSILSIDRPKSEQRWREREREIEEGECKGSRSDRGWQKGE